MEHDETLTQKIDWDDLEVRKKYAPAGMKAFGRMMEKWDVSLEDQCAILGGVSQDSYLAWRKEEGDVSKLEVPERETLERIGVTLGIYKALRTIYNNEANYNGWITSPNTSTLCNGKAPIERMAEGGLDDLEAVRNYLLAVQYG